MREQLVSFELAKKLKDLGFDWKTEKYWCLLIPNGFLQGNLGVHSRDWNKEENLWSAPTLSHAQQWLREEKDVIVLVNFEKDHADDVNDTGKYSYKITNPTKTSMVVCRKDQMTRSYNEILEAGLLQACELLKD